MPWNFNENTPIYQQIIEHIKLSIAVGEYSAGDKLLPVRELASVAEVNPNTMQKALYETERQGLIFSMRTSGKYITNDENIISELKSDTARTESEIFINKMIKLGFTKDEILTIISNTVHNM